jgi:hypothetical protein
LLKTKWPGPKSVATLKQRNLRLQDYATWASVQVASRLIWKGWDLCLVLVSLAWLVEHLRLQVLVDLVQPLVSMLGPMLQHCNFPIRVNTRYEYL